MPAYCQHAIRSLGRGTLRSESVFSLAGASSCGHHDGTVDLDNDDDAGHHRDCATGPLRHCVPARGPVDLHLAVRPQCVLRARHPRYLPSQPNVYLVLACGLRQFVCRLPTAGTQPTTFTNATLTNAVSGVVSANGFPSGINNIQVQRLSYTLSPAVAIPEH